MDEAPPHRGQSESRGGSVIDLFAGPGGWDVGARALGIDPIGLEWDDAACATRRAAGLRTMQCDVAKVDFDAGWRGSRIAGLIASPPCQAWSMAGKGGGRRDKEHVVRCAGELAAGVDTRARHAEECEDPRSILVVEPLRWALALEPEWLAFEQVPPVLELWSMFAQILTLKGYTTWAGVLEAERYGVPQTRERAVLIARRTGAVHPPTPTHQRYVPGQPQRHDVTLEGEVLPWVSMATALGLEEGPRPAPAPTVTSGGSAQGGVEVFAGVGSRERVRAAVVQTNNFSAIARDADGSRSAAGSVRYERPLDAPAPTVTSQTRLWHLPDWAAERPSTTVMGDPRIARPGHHGSGDARDPAERSMTDSVRVTVEQAATLQTFPAGYPWQGTRSQQHMQVGNAVPPVLAMHILRALTGAQIIEREAAA